MRSAINEHNIIVYIVLKHFQYVFIPTLSLLRPATRVDSPQHDVSSKPITSQSAAKITDVKEEKGV